MLVKLYTIAIHALKLLCSFSFKKMSALKRGKCLVAIFIALLHGLFISNSHLINMSLQNGKKCRSVVKISEVSRK